MTYFNYLGTWLGDPLAQLSGLSDLDLIVTDGGLRVLASYQSGSVVELRNSTSAMGLLATTPLPVAAGLNAQVSVELNTLATGQVALQVGNAGAGVAMYSVASTGQLIFERTVASGQTVTAAEVVEIGPATFLFTASMQSPGVTVWERQPSGTYHQVTQSGEGLVSDIRQIADISHLQVSGQDYLLAASAATSTVALLRVEPNGTAPLIDQLNPGEGLWVNAPSHVETLQMNGMTFAVVGSSGSGSISVIEVQPGGSLRLVDQITDDLNTRFQTIGALKTVVVGERAFVVAGGADDGLSLFTMLPNGRLLHLETIADTNDSALTNVTAIDAIVTGGKLRIIASGEGLAAASQFDVDLTDLGVTVIADEANLNPTSGGGDDLLFGSDTANQMNGGSGADILFDGGGTDRLTGGSGADTFVFAEDGSLDFVQDFEVGIDRLDLSALGRAYTKDSITFSNLSGGLQLAFGGEVTRLYSQNGLAIDPADLALSDLFGVAHIDAFSPAKDGYDRYGTQGPDTIFGGAGDGMLSGEGANVSFDIPAASVFRLYRAALDRTPDRPGHLDWTQQLETGTASLEDVAAGFIGSPEFQAEYGGSNNADFVTLLYDNVLNRAPDAGGLAHWTGQLDGGAMTRAQVVLGFSESQEFIATARSGSVLFSDAGYEQDWVDEVFRLYQATLDRAPDLPGLLSWVDILAGGQDFLSVVSGFVESVEFQANYGATTNTEFVTLLYSNVLDRAPDPAGLASWVGALNSGSQSREEVVRGFSESPEFIAATKSEMIDFMQALDFGDRLLPASGTDILFGGYLADTFVFNAVDQGDHSVADFEIWDQLELLGFGYGSKAEATSHFSPVADGLLFQDQGTNIALEHYSMTDLTVDNFILF